MSEETQSSQIEGTYTHSTIKADDPEIIKLYGERTAQTACQHLIPHIKPDAHILDVGCGPGTITVDLATLAPQGTTIGLDNNPGVITQAQTTYPQTTHPNLTFTTGDALTLPYPDSTFTLVHAHALLVHLRDPITPLREMLRVLKPGGLLSCRETSPSIILSMTPEISGVREYHETVARLMPYMGGHSSAGRELAGWAREAGVVDGEGGWKVQFQAGRTKGASHSSRVTREAGKQMVATGLVKEEDVDRWREGWAEFDATKGAEIVFETGELLVWKPVEA